MNRPTSRRLLRPLALTLAGFGLLPQVLLGVEPATAVAVCRPGELETADHDFTGRIGPEDPIEVRAPAAGIVKKVSIKAGDSVRKGDVLFRCRWNDEVAENSPLVAAVRESEAELKRCTEAVEEGGKLAKSTPEELAKEYESALDRLKEQFDKAIKQTTTVIQAGLSPTRRDEVQKLLGALERAYRLAKARRDSSLDTFYEGELTRLRPAVLRAAMLSETRGKGEKARQFTADLREIQKGIDRAILISRARSKEGLDVVAAQRDLAAATLKNARDGLDAARRNVRPERIVAPVAGQVLRVVPAAEERIESSGALATLLCVLAPTSTVRVAFNMDEATLERLDQLARAGKLPVKALPEVPVRLGLPAEEDFPHAGTLGYLDNRLDPKSHVLHCRASFPNSDGVLTNAAFARGGKGEFVRLRLTLGEPRKVLLVPRQSVLTDENGKSQVLVVDEKNRVELKAVRTGAEYGNLRTVVDGLSATDWVVVGPADRKGEAGATLRPGDFVRDLRLLNLKPGTTVEPLHISLPDTEGTERPKP